MARKKPTMKETVSVINQMIREITTLKNEINTITSVIEMYVDMNNQTIQFNEFVNKKLNVKANDDVRRNEEDSTVAMEGSPEN